MDKDHSVEKDITVEEFFEQGYDFAQTTELSQQLQGFLKANKDANRPLVVVTVMK